MHSPPAMNLLRYLEEDIVLGINLSSELVTWPITPWPSILIVRPKTISIYVLLYSLWVFLMINEYLILTFLWLCLKQFLRYQLTWPLRRLVLVLLSLYWINSLWTLDRNPVAFVLYLFRLIKVSDFVLCFNYIYIVCFSFDIYLPTLRCQ